MEKEEIIEELSKLSIEELEKEYERTNQLINELKEEENNE